MKSFIRIAIFLTILFKVDICQAQFKIKLQDVTKFEFETRGGGLSNYYSGFQVIFKKNKWECSKLKPVMADAKTATIGYAAPQFIRNISQDTLQLLLDKFAQADSIIDIKRFNFDKMTILHDFDSLSGVKFKQEQKAELAKAIQSDDLLNETVTQLFHPLFTDDATYYGIKITTKENITYHAFAYSFAYPYDLPWTVGHTKSYDPEISVIFNRITGHPTFAEMEHQLFQQNIALWLYRNKFQTRFNFDNLRTDYPASFKILNHTFTPVNLSSEVMFKELLPMQQKYRGVYSARVNSSRLPSYVQISFGFKMDDTAALKRVKRYEDTLVRCFKKNNFLFDYLKTRSDCIVLFTPAQMGNRGQWMFRALRPNFPGIDKYDYKKVQLITIVSPAVIMKWMLLPDNILILCQYKNRDNGTTDTQFMGLEKVLNDRSYSGNEEICLVFNASGKLIHDYGVVKNPFID